MKIALSGSTGLVGKSLAQYFQSKGAAVIPIKRVTGIEGPQRNYIPWNPRNQQFNLESLEGLDAVIHLAGANIADRRWTKGYKKIIWDSRVQATQALSAALAQLKKPPALFLCASAIGYYGAREAHELIDENADPGQDFLAQLCVHWERATQSAQKAGIRVVNMRLGVVLSPHGGALKKMLPIFKLGLGGKLGTGKQMMSWIDLDEIPRAVDFLWQHRDIKGPVNFVSPQPVSNREFTKIFAKCLQRPAVLPAPAFALRLVLGEMADALLLNGAKIIPQKLIQNGYHFLYDDLERAVVQTLRK